MHVIICLGDKNDARGGLPESARTRAEGALAAYRATAGSKLLVTGGYGAFNRAPLPHAHYVQQHLLARGVPAGDLLPIVESRHTVDDAAMSRAALAPLDVGAITVVTSHFHVDRAALIFSCFFDPAQLSFVATPNGLSGEALERRRAHEQASIALIRRQGGILYQDTLWPLPSDGAWHT
jgi:uncharacterized SAM-binding protein YcdF (DUF218 family)